MEKQLNKEDTICAIATPAGFGGISVIRISGSRAIASTRELCAFIGKQPKSHRIYVGVLRDFKSKQPIDEVVVTIFLNNRSFTGEETVEISCHGSPAICQQILNNLVLIGVRLADRGEFTYRAFMNGKIDLVQAESVLSMITAESQQASSQAYRQLKGDLSRKLKKIKDDFVWCLANLEAEIDFFSEDITVIAKEEIKNKILDVSSEIKEFLGSYRYGKVIKDGFHVVLIGEPNVGKSSLFNALVEEDRAIVTDIPGTTRDLIEGMFNYKGQKFVVVDTAGLHNDADEIESIGIERSMMALKEADAILVVFDLSKGLNQKVLEKLEEQDISKVIIIGNKKDIVENFEKQFLSVSAFQKDSVDILKESLFLRINKENFQDRALISQARHFENLVEISKNCEQVIKNLDLNLSNEFITIDLKEALIKTQEILGERFDDQVMDRVFREFCVGK